MPVSFIDSGADEIFPTDLTVQSPAYFMGLLNVAGVASAEGEPGQPLCWLEITRFTKLNSTSIGMCSSHMLCAFCLDPLAPLVVLTGMISVDGSSHLLFLRLLSQRYQGLGPLDPPPYYEPEAIKFTESPEVPHPTFPHCDPSVPPWELPGRMEMEFVVFRLTATQLKEMHDPVAKGMEHLRMSRVDPVVGLVARCLSEVVPESKPIDTISHVVNVRAFICLPSPRLILPQHRGMGIYPHNSALNAIIWVPGGIPASKGTDPREGVLAYAIGIRKSLARLKDPRFIKGMTAGLSKILSQDAWYNHGQDILTGDEGCLIVNSLWK